MDVCMYVCINECMYERNYFLSCQVSRSKNALLLKITVNNGRF